MTNDERMEIVNRHVKELGEFFDTVQIFVTVYQPEDELETHTLTDGTGNWYARCGQVAEWQEMNMERIREHQRRKDREDRL